MTADRNASTSTFNRYNVADMYVLSLRVRSSQLCACVGKIRSFKKLLIFKMVR